MWVPRDPEKFIGLVLRIGATSGIAVFLAYKLAGSFEARMVAMEQQGERLAVGIHETKAALETVEQHRKDSDVHTQQLLYGICLGVNYGNAAAQRLCPLPVVN